MLQLLINRNSRRALLMATIAVLIVSAACGGDDNSELATSEPSTPPPPTGTAPTHGDPPPSFQACSGCHSTGTNTIVGPEFEGFKDRAGSRVPGLTAVEYVTQSIKDPGTFIVPGFPNVMPKNFSDTLTEGEIADLVAWLPSW